jgi:hypothetical protein
MPLEPQLIAETHAVVPRRSRLADIDAAHQQTKPPFESRLSNPWPANVMFPLLSNTW